MTQPHGGQADPLTVAAEAAAQAYDAALNEMLGNPPGTVLPILAPLADNQAWRAAIAAALATVQPDPAVTAVLDAARAWRDSGPSGASAADDRLIAAVDALDVGKDDFVPVFEKVRPSDLAMIAAIVDSPARPELHAEFDDDEPTHHYLSTGCLHGEHGYCQTGKTKGGVTKAPAQCKFCRAPCVCDCHQEADRG